MGYNSAGLFDFGGFLAFSQVGRKMWENFRATRQAISGTPQAGENL